MLHSRVGVLLVTLVMGCSTEVAGLGDDFNDAAAFDSFAVGDGTKPVEDDTTAPSSDSAIEPADTGDGAAPADTGSPAIDSGTLPVDTGMVVVLDSGTPADTAKSDTASGTDSAAAMDSKTSDTATVTDTGWSFDSAGFDAAGIDTAGSSCYAVACSKRADCPTSCSACASWGRCAP